MERTMKFSRSRRYVIYLAAAGVVAGGGYGLYAFLSSEYTKRNWLRMTRFLESCTKFEESLYSASEITTVVVNDLRDFLSSESDEVPKSLKQFSKLCCTEAFQQAISSASFSMTTGILRGVNLGSSHCDGASNSTKNDRHLQVSSKENVSLVITVLDKLFSEEGRGFASAVVGRAVRSLVHAFSDNSTRSGYRNGEKGSTGKHSLEQRASGSDAWIRSLSEIACTERGRLLLTQCCSSFAESMVGTYLDRTGDINMFEDIMQGVSNHTETAKDIGSHLCSTLAETIIRCCLSRKESKEAVQSSRNVSLPVETSSDSSQQSTWIRLMEGSGHRPKSSLPEDLGRFLSNSATRSLIIETAGAVSAQGMKTFLLVVLGLLRSKLVPSKSFSPSILISETSEDEQKLMKGEDIVRNHVCRSAAAHALVVSTVCLSILLHLMTIYTSTSASNV